MPAYADSPPASGTSAAGPGWSTRMVGTFTWLFATFTSMMLSQPSTEQVSVPVLVRVTSAVCAVSVDGCAAIVTLTSLMPQSSYRGAAALAADPGTESAGRAQAPSAARTVTASRVMLRRRRVMPDGPGPGRSAGPCRKPGDS